jgi:hypothetical protein
MVVMQRVIRQPLHEPWKRMNNSSVEKKRLHDNGSMPNIGIEKPHQPQHK